METEITASEFKAKCLQLMDQIAATGQEITITKRGKPVARLLPPKPFSHPKKFSFGCLKGTMEITGDIMAPLGVEWAALSDEHDPLL